MQKVINRLAEKGFCDKSGHPKPNFAYFQYPQSYSVARIASILRGLANYYHLANSKRQCVTRLSYILRTSLAKTYAAKFKLGTAAKVFAKGGRDLSKPIKAKKGRRPLLNRVLGSKTTAHRRRGRGVKATPSHSLHAIWSNKATRHETANQKLATRASPLELHSEKKFVPKLS